MVSGSLERKQESAFGSNTQSSFLLPQLAIAPSSGELQPREVGVKPVLPQQLGMCAGLDDTPLVHDHDVVVAQHLAVAPALPDEDGGVYKSENTAMD